MKVEKNNSGNQNKAIVVRASSSSTTWALNFLKKALASTISFPYKAAKAFLHLFTTATY